MLDVSRMTSASSVAEVSVSSEALATPQLPIANAGAAFHVSRSSGRFHGEITPTTPSGLRVT
jgi:hypothetical protein